jgi:AcrR family transcriptional regulator
MNEPQPLDRRTRRTRRALQEALLNLAEEEDLESITIQEITDRADINRATFYQHYRDKDALISSALDMLFEEVTAEDRTFTDQHMTLSPDVVPTPLVALFRNLDRHRFLFRRIYCGSDKGGFALRLQIFEEQQFYRVWEDMALEPDPGSPPVQARAWVGTNIVRGFVTWWLIHGEGVSIETAAEWLWTLCKPLLFSDATPKYSTPTES